MKLYTPYLPMKLTILLLSSRTNEEIALRASEIVHTREMRLSTVRTAAACVRHNYIMRCTLAYLEDLRRTRPRECTVPMGTSNEMVVTVSHPAKVVAEGYAGGCALFPRGDDTGPPDPPRLCQHQQYAIVWWTNAYESGPVGTEVLTIWNKDENAWRLRRDVSPQ